MRAETPTYRVRARHKGEKADSVYPRYGNNPHNSEDTVAIQPIPSRYIRYVADTEDTVSLGSRSYPLDPLDLERILWIFWIPMVFSRFSGFPMYRSDPHRIPDVSFGSPSYSRYGNSEEIFGSGVRWGPGGYIADPENPKQTVESRGYQDTGIRFFPLGTSPG